MDLVQWNTRPIEDELRVENEELKHNLKIKHGEIGRAEHRGNTVNYIYDKCENYGNQVMALGNDKRKLEAKLETAKEALKLILGHNQVWAIRELAEQAIKDMEGEK